MKPYFSIVIPAFNEQDYIRATLEHLFNAVDKFIETGKESEVIVVDNASTDNTAKIARSLGARIVHENLPGIGRARNAGARASKGIFIIFLDADTLVSDNLLERIHKSTSQDDCIGGAVSTDYRPRRYIDRKSVV